MLLVFVNTVNVVRLIFVPYNVHVYGVASFLLACWYEGTGGLVARKEVLLLFLAHVAA